MKYRDGLGRLCYKVQSADGTSFEVVQGDNRIVHNRGLCGRWDAVMLDKVLLWVDLPKFDSFIKAVSFLKANISKLL